MLSRWLCTSALSALFLLPHPAAADEFTDPEVDIQDDWLGAEVSAKFGDEPAVHDRDGVITTFSGTYMRGPDTAGDGSLSASVIGNGSGVVRSKTGLYYHMEEGGNLGTSSQSLKPFVVQGSGTVSTSIAIHFDGLLVVNEQSGSSSAWSQAVVEYLAEIQTVDPASGTRVTVGNNTFDGHANVKQVGGGAAPVVNVPEEITENDAEDGPSPNSWHNNSGLVIRKVVTADAATGQIDVGTLTGETKTRAQEHLDAGRKVYFLVYDQTFAFDATGGQTYFVHMDLFTAVNSSTGAYSNTAYAVSDFSNTVTYALSGGSGITTAMMIDGAQNVGGDDAFGGLSSQVTLDGATLTLTNDAGLAENYILQRGTTNTVNTGGHAGAMSGVVSGAGSLVKAGLGTLTLAGANTYTGGTTVSGGTLQLASAGALPGGGAVSVAAGATLDLDGHAQSIGTLSGAGTIALGNATLSAGDADSSTFSGVIGGTGGLTKAGSGTLTLAGANTYTGVTTVGAGTLAVTGSLASPVTVQSGGRLQGSGTVASLTANAAGTIGPGNSIGTLTVDGAAAFGAGSVYQAEVAPATADRINAGTATIDSGAAVQVVAANGTYAPTTSYTILNAAGGITGTFGSVTSSMPFLAPSLSYDANNVTLTLTRDFGSFARETGHGTLGGALDRASADPGRSADMDTVATLLAGLTTSQASTALQSMSGETTLSAGSAAHGGTTRAMGVVAGRTAALRSGSAAAGGRSHTALAPDTWLGLMKGQPAAAEEQAVRSPIRRSISGPMLDDTGAAEIDGPLFLGLGNGAGAESSWGAWTRGFGLLTSHDGATDANDYRYTQAGFLTGLDYKIADSLVVGLSGGLSQGKVDHDSIADETDIRSYYLGVYGGWADAGWYVDGQINYALHRNQSSRDVLLGAVTRKAEADFDSSDSSAYLEAGRSFALSGGWSVTPFVSAEVRRSHQEAYEERGAGAVGLQVDSATSHSGRGGIGTLVAYEMTAGDGSTYSPFVQARWLHGFGDRSVSTDARFTGSPAGTFAMAGEEAPLNSAVLGAGFDMAMENGVTLRAGYDLTLSDDDAGHALTLGLRFEF